MVILRVFDNFKKFYRHFLKYISVKRDLFCAYCIIGYVGLCMLMIDNVLTLYDVLLMYKYALYSYNIHCYTLYVCSKCTINRTV